MCVVVSSRAAQTFRARIDAVQVTVTGVDAERLVTGLTRDDFEIREDDVPRRITQFSDERVPVSPASCSTPATACAGSRIVVRAAPLIGCQRPA